MVAIEAQDEQGRTPFYSAIEIGNREAAALLLTQGANPTVSCGAAELSTLHIATERGDIEILKYLLQTRAVALIDMQNAKGDTPLHLAVQAGHDSMIPLLLEAGAYHKIKNEQDQTPIELARMQQKPKLANLIVQTVRGRKQAKLKETDKLHQVVSEQANKITRLEAALQSQGQAFKEQISYIQSENKHFMSDKKTMQEKIKLLQILLENTGDFSKRDKNGRTPVHIAVEHLCTDITLFMAAGADVNALDNNGRTPIHAAAQMGRVDIITALKAAGADVNKKCGADGETPVYIAAQNGHAAAITALIAAGANANTQNREGKTPLYIAAENGHAVAIAALKAAGANVDMLANYYSVDYGYVSSSHKVVVMTAVSEYSLDGAKGVCECNRGTPVFIASGRGHVAAVSALIAAGANVNIPDSHGKTPIYIAAENGHSEVITALKAAGANVNIPAKSYTKSGDYCSTKVPYHRIFSVQNMDQMTDLNGVRICDLGTPVFIAAQNGHAAAITALHAAGANMSTTNQYGQTLVCIAAQNGHAAAITALHAVGANVDMPNKEGKTPVFIAAENGNAEVITALGTVGANMNKLWEEKTPVCIVVEIVMHHLDASNKNTSPGGNEASYIARYMAVIAALLECGADASIKTKHGTALEIATRGFSLGYGCKQTPGHLAVVKIFEEHFIRFPNGVKPLSIVNQKVFLPAKPHNPPEQKNPPMLSQFHQLVTPTPMPGAVFNQPTFHFANNVGAKANQTGN